MSIKPINEGSDPRAVALFSRTHRLARIGRVKRSPSEAAAPTPFARLCFTGQPSVFVRGGEKRRRRDDLTGSLEDALKRARRLHLDVVWPVALLEEVATSGLKWEYADPAGVLTGRELVLCTELPDRGNIDDVPATELFDLYELAQGALTGGSGKWRLAWQEVPNAKGVLLEVAFRVGFRDGLTIAGRGDYLIGGAHSKPGFEGLRNAENTIVIEVTSEGRTVVFWLGRGALDVLIPEIHNHVALGAICGQPIGYFES